MALGFIGQASRLGDAFDSFALVLLPALFVMGLVTCLRLTQNAIEDAVYARAINRIRRYYTEIDPERARYFLLPAHDDLEGVLAGAGRHHSRWHLLSSRPSASLPVASLKTRDGPAPAYPKGAIGVLASGAPRNERAGPADVREP